MNQPSMNGGNMLNGVPGNMAAMNNAANAGTPRTQDGESSEYKSKLNTYIYDYLLKNEQYDCARLLLKSSLSVITKPSGAKKRNDDSMDTDSKDDIDLNKPADLPLPDRILDANTENSFLLDWFTLFWEIFLAPRAQKPPKLNPSAVQYTNHIRDQSRARQEAQNNFLRQPGVANMQQYNMMRMQQQGMAPQNMNDLRNRLNAQNPQLARQQQQQLMHNRMLQQQQMERAGSEAEMNGQRPRTPSSMMQGMEGMPEFYGNGQMRQGMPQTANGAGGNHALQDYQMQLMLLEQQNKKRLLMARQEQDNLRPDQQGNMPGQPFPGPGPQGQPMMNPQQAQQMQQQMQQQAQQQGQSGPQPGQPPQNPQAQAQMGTPHQRNAAMPPPQNVPAAGAAAGATNGRPASPAQSAASVTPQQANKPNPKKKDTKEPRKRPNKKGAAAAATPSAEGDAPPATPGAPATPITPMAKGFNEQTKNGQQNQNAQAPANASAANQGVPQSQPDQGMMTQFEGMDGGQMDDVNMDFSGLDTGDVLTTFDFDAFLQDDGANPDMDFGSFGNYDGLEAGGDAA